MGTRTTEAVDVVVTDVFPSDFNYPPTIWTHQVQINMTTLIQNDIQQGVSRAVSTPRVDVSTGACTVIVSVQGETYTSANEGHAPGWGYVNTYDSNLVMTDLWANTDHNNPPTSNTGSSFIFVALDYNTYIGLHLRNDESACPTVTTTASATF